MNTTDTVRASIDEDALRITVVLRGRTHTGSWDDDASVEPDAGSDPAVLAAALCVWDGATGTEFDTTEADLAATGFWAPPPRRLTQERARRVISLCRIPMRASRASERVHRLALGAQARGEYRLAGDLFGLSTALNERRHAILQSWLPGGTARPEYGEHCEEISILIGRLPSEVRT